MSELTSRIDHALTAPRPDEAVDKIHAAVADELRRLDPALDEIAHLGNFNHSYRPDFVLRWGTGRGKRERPVFLRLVAGGMAARLDVEILGERRPLFLGLLHHRLSSGDTRVADAAAAVAEAAAGSALMTDATALDALDADDVRAPTVATSALVRGGSGLLDSEVALALRDAVSGGYAAAIAGGDPEAVDRAAEALRPFLSEQDTARVNLQLDLLWLAGGGDLDDLEDGTRLLHADLKPDEWTLLLDQFLAREEPSDQQLWRLFGSRLTLDDAAAAMSKIREKKHLDAFVEANAGRWTARYAGVIEHRDADQRGWWITDDSLAFGRGTVSVVLTASKRRFNRTGAPLARRSFDALREAMRGDELLTLDAREGTTSIRLTAEDALPPDRVDQVVRWTNEIQGLTVETAVGSEQVLLSVSYVEGKLETNKKIPLDDLRRRAVRYLDVPPAVGDSVASAGHATDATTTPAIPDASDKTKDESHRGGGEDEPK